MRRLQVLAGVVLLGALPLGSRVFGDGFFAWSMFARTGQHRVDVMVRERSAGTHPISPTGLAEHAGRGAAVVLVGAEEWRYGSSVAVFRAHLADFALFVCSERPVQAVTVELRERSDPDAETRTTRASVVCP